MSFSRVYDILASNAVLSRFFKKMPYFNVNCQFGYIMKIYKYEGAICIEEICSQGSLMLARFPKVSMHVPKQ